MRQNPGGFRNYYIVEIKFCQAIQQLTKSYLHPIILNMKKDLTSKQQDFLGHLKETGGDPKKAAEAIKIMSKE